jgi:hypothetical protein
MSIALMNRIKDLEQRVDELRAQVRRDYDLRFEADLKAFQEQIVNRLSALENRPKPGRPPKHG